jgi:hypothetical protein
MPHGGLSYALLFSQDNSAVSNPNDLQLLGNLAHHDFTICAR